MKPELLIMHNIGPFLHEKVDFSQLNNMFLVAGKTGAGKTTIFDAMIFALFGEFSGNRKKNSANFKSDYSAQDDTAYIDFTFSLSGKKYRVYRTLQQKYINRNGKEDKHLSEVKLETIDSNGTVVTFNGKTNETNEKIKNLIGLTAAEFEQIVVLPQGAFAKFLHENSNDRRETLAKLFPVSLYQTIAERAKKQADDYYGKKKLLTDKITELAASFDAEKAPARKEELTTQIENIEKKITELHNQTKKLSAKKEHFSTEYNNACTYEDLQSKKQLLENKKSNIEEKKIILQKSEAAEKLGEYLRNKTNTKKTVEQLQEKINTTENRKHQADKNFKQLCQLKEKFETLKKENGKNRITADSLKKMSAQLERLELTEKKQKTAQTAFEENCKKQQGEEKQLTELRKVILKTADIIENNEQYTLEYFPLAEITGNITLIKEQKKTDKEKISEAIEKAQQKETLLKEIKKIETTIHKTETSITEFKKIKTTTEQILQELQEQKKQEEENNKACALAHLLKQGEPCPVCGAIEHPAPVQALTITVDLDTKISTEQKNIELNSSKITDLEKEVNTQTAIKSEKQKLHDSIKTDIYLEDAQNKYTQISEELETLKTQSQSIKQNTVLYQQQEEIYKKTTAKSAELQLQEKSLNGSLKTLLSEITSVNGLDKAAIPKKNEIQKKITALENTIQQNETQYNKWDNDFHSAEKETASTQAQFETLKTELEKAETLCSSALEEFKEHLLSSIFNNEQEVQKALLTPEQKNTFMDEVTRWEQDSLSVETLLKNSSTTKPSKDIKQELVSIEEEIEHTEQNSEEAHRNMQNISFQLSQLSADIQKWEKLEQERIKTEKESQTVIQLSNDLNGNNPKKIPFEIWVLGMYFDEVVLYANTRFIEFSDGRYSFKLADNQKGGKEYKGLDLQVIDSFTGTLRDTAMLSGGETFMASISLALALTDVVQSKSGGIKLDSLFIDEGFGSLDTEALDSAIGILNQLQETRMVGVISHVESMKTAIDSCIQVEKGPAGSHIKII